MSVCSHCLMGTCRRHPLLDHGKREEQLTAQAGAISTSARGVSLTQLLRGQIQRLDRERDVLSSDTDHDRQLLAQHREAVLASQQSRASGTKRARDDSHGLALSGLNPSVIAVMNNSDSDEDGESEDSIARDTDVKKHKKDKKDKSKRSKDKKESKSRHKRDKNKEEKKSKKSHSDDQ
jgi:hypothetical protein